MQRGQIDSGTLPLYHDDMLIVKTTPNPQPAEFAAPLAVGGAMSIGAAPAALTPGLSALAWYERSGLIKRVTPLGNPSPAPASFGPLSSTAMVMNAGGAPVGAPTTPSTGVSIVELQPNANAQQLQASLGNDPNIEFVAPVPVRYLWAKKKKKRVGGATPAAAPPNPATMWNLQKIRWAEALAAGLDAASGVHVAVLDTGIDVDHPDLPGDDITYVYDYRPDSPAATSPKDVIGHGTHVAGTIRALMNNQFGVNGICNCRLSAYKIFDDVPASRPVLSNSPYYPYYVDPILYRAALAACLDAGVNVINLSIGGYGAPDPQEASLFKALIDGGTTIVAAMGNDNTTQPSYPAAVDRVIAVGATSIDDARAYFSNIGAHIGLSAPGVAIWSTLPTYDGQSGFWAVRNADGSWTRGAAQKREKDYAAWQGTSMAAPHVAAAAALALAKTPGLSPEKVKRALQKAVDKTPGMHGKSFTAEFGAGRLNLLKI